MTIVVEKFLFNVKDKHFADILLLIVYKHYIQIFTLITPLSKNVFAEIVIIALGPQSKALKGIIYLQNKVDGVHEP